MEGSSNPMQSRFRRGAGSVSVCLVCVSCPSVCLSSVALDRNRKLVVKWQGALEGAGRLEVPPRVQAPADMSENGMCASSAATKVARVPHPLGLPGAGRRAGYY